MVRKPHLAVFDHHFFAKVRGQFSKMRGARKLLIGRLIVHVCAIKPLNNSFLARRMLQIWLSTFAKKMLFRMGENHFCAVRSLTNIGAVFHTPVRNSKSLIDVNEHICIRYCVSDAMLWMYFVVAAESVQVNTFQKRSFFKWNFMIYNFCVKKFDMIKIFDFLKSPQKLFRRVPSKFPYR